MENGFPHVKRIDLNEWLRYKQLPFVCEKPLSTDLNSARYLQEIAP
ncbi:dehydrogenase, partial [Salmonella enterica]|nr:dehydrogenase [Salmonella enterica subsp. enterica serovar Kentucky]EFO1079620.1 dehydrogenase [Escherichia coli]ECU6006908.1 dehydrogenase [Salmonella enterica subsp. enterica serovar Kentucky]EEJ0476489.1 dehydrogenase [Salmonella enterica subsp. enterica serovar Kentucky]EEJ0576690.1 dehydrogenase [Salmonella enterica subsp. enterica serovar Kentucky]